MDRAEPGNDLPVAVLPLSSGREPPNFIVIQAYGPDKDCISQLLPSMKDKAKPRGSRGDQVE